MSGIRFRNLLYVNKKSNLFFDFNGEFPEIIGGTDFGVDYQFKNKESA
jgi:hypothetical protein